VIVLDDRDLDPFLERWDDAEVFWS